MFSFQKNLSNSPDDVKHTCLVQQKCQISIFPKIFSKQKQVNKTFPLDFLEIYGFSSAPSTLTNPTEPSKSRLYSNGSQWSKLARRSGSFGSRFVQAISCREWDFLVETINVQVTLPETDSSPLKMDGWNTIFLLGRPIFRGYVSFRESVV